MCWLVMMAASLAGQNPAPTTATAAVPASVGSVAPGEPAPIGVSGGATRTDRSVNLSQFVDEATAGGMTPMPAPPTLAAPAAPTFGGTTTAIPASPVFMETRNAFQSDHAFDGFTGPMFDPIQAKDPRSLTEARLMFINNWGRPGTPVLGNGSYQVYALQLRLAVTERLQLFADKDGIVRLSPNPGGSVTGLANLAAGAKFVLIRDEERQFLFSTAVQYEAPTGYANIYQNQGSGLLGVYGILGKEFWGSSHLLLQFGQNTALQNQQNGYFYTHVHLDRRFGRFVPFTEFNWYYYNQSAKFLPAAVDLEGAGLLNLGTAGFTGNSFVTAAVGAKFTISPNAEFGVGYNFPLSDRKMLYGDMLQAELIVRY